MFAALLSFIAAATAPLTANTHLRSDSLGDATLATTTALPGGPFSLSQDAVSQPNLTTCSKLRSVTHFHDTLACCPPKSGSVWNMMTQKIGATFGGNSQHWSCDGVRDSGGVAGGSKCKSVRPVSPPAESMNPKPWVKVSAKGHIDAMEVALRTLQDPEKEGRACNGNYSTSPKAMYDDGAIGQFEPGTDGMKGVPDGWKAPDNCGLVCNPTAGEMCADNAGNLATSLKLAEYSLSPDYDESVGECHMKCKDWRNPATGAADCARFYIHIDVNAEPPRGGTCHLYKFGCVAGVDAGVDMYDMGLFGATASCTGGDADCNHLTLKCGNQYCSCVEACQYYNQNIPTNQANPRTGKAHGDRNGKLKDQEQCEAAKCHVAYEDVDGWCHFYSKDGCEEVQTNDQNDVVFRVAPASCSACSKCNVEPYKC